MLEQRGPAARWTAFAVTSLALLMSSIDSTSVATALASVQRDLETSFVWAGWTITIYSVGLILASPVAARLAERFGTRRVFLCAVAAFTVVSVLCAACRSIEPLIGLRFVQGLAGGLLIPTATGIVSHEFGQNRDRAIGLFASIFPVGAIIGPLLGGVILNLWSWRGIFLVNLPVGVLLLAAGLATVREVPRTGGSRLDLRGTLMITALLISGMAAIGLTPGIGRSWSGSLQFAGASIVAVAAGWAYWRHARREPQAVVPLRLLRGRHVGTINLMNVLYGAAVLGFSATVPHYAQVRYGIDPLSSGVLLTGRAVVVICASLFAVAVLRALGHKPLLLTGMSMVVLGLVLTATPPVGMGPGLWLMLAAGVLGLGTGLAAPASNNMGMHLMPESAPAVAALRRTFRQTGSILAVSITTAVGAASADQGSAAATAFVALAVVMTVALVVAARIPNQRGRW